VLRCAGCTSGAQVVGRRARRMERTMRLQAVLMGLALTTSTSVGASQPISIRVSPAMSFAPANLVIRTSVEPHADNRVMEIVADAEDFYRASTVQLEGDRAPKTTIFEFRSLPPGDYNVTAAVFGADGRQRGAARAQIHVVESGMSR